MNIIHPKKEEDERAPPSPWTAIGCFWFLLGISLVITAVFLAPALADRISP